MCTACSITLSHFWPCSASVHPHKRDGNAKDWSGDGVDIMQEFTGTAVMMVSMQLLEKRGAGLSQDGLILWNTLKALYSAFIIAVLILGLGGPTGRSSS